MEDSEKELIKKFNKEFYRLTLVIAWSILLSFYWMFSGHSNGLLPSYIQRMEKIPAGLSVPQPAWELLSQKHPINKENLSNLNIKVEPSPAYEIIKEEPLSAEGRGGEVEIYRLITTKALLSDNFDKLHQPLNVESKTNYYLNGKIDRKWNLGKSFSWINIIIWVQLILILIVSVGGACIGALYLKKFNQPIDLSFATAFAIFWIGVVQCSIAFAQGGPLISPIGSVLATTAAIVLGQFFYIGRFLFTVRRNSFYVYLTMLLPFFVLPIIAHVLSNWCFDYGDLAIIKQIFGDKSWYLSLTGFSILLGGFVTYKRYDERLEVKIDLGLTGAIGKLINQE